MLKSETKTIGENQYTVTVLPVQQGREGLVRLQKLLGAGLAQVTNGTRADIPRALAGISERLTAADLEWFCSSFGKATQVALPPDEAFPNGRTLSLAHTDAQTAVFSGNFLEMFEWLEFCLELNYGQLLEKLKGAIESASAQAVAPKAEPKK